MIASNKQPPFSSLPSNLKKLEITNITIVGATTDLQKQLLGREFQIRPIQISNAVEFLKKENPLYFHVNIEGDIKEIIKGKEFIYISLLGFIFLFI